MKCKSPFTRAPRTWQALLAVSALFAVGLYFYPGAGRAHGEPPAGSPIVSTALVVEKTVSESHVYSGRIEAVDRVEIRPRVAGYIDSVNFRPGALVRKGQLLFVIDPRPYEAEARRAEAAAVAARTKADLARTELQRAVTLAAEQAIAQRELDQKRAVFQELEAAARSAQALSDAARLNLKYTRVESPISGRVGKAELTAGNLVDSGAVLATVVANSPLYASFDASQDAFLRAARAIRSGVPVGVRIAAANEAAFDRPGTLEFIDNQVDPGTGTVHMRARLDNRDNALVPGVFAKVELGDGEAGGRRAVLIAERAVGTDQDRKFVYVVSRDGKAEYRQVQLGAVVGSLRVVEAGLKPGEQIVVNGLQHVRPGVPLAPRLVPMEPEAHAPGSAATPAGAAQS